jgi:hypothetical protein
MSPWLALAAVLLVSPATPEARAEHAATPPAVTTPDGGRKIVFLMPVNGEAPPDSLAGMAFVAGVRAVFDAGRYPTERSRADRSGSGPVLLSLPLTNCFQLVLGEPFGDEWQVTITVMSWLSGASADTLRGVRVNVAVLSPEAVAVGARPLPVREDLILHVPVVPRDAWYWHAGRMTGLLAMEELHHQSGDLPPDARVRLDRTVRNPVIERRPPTRRR